MAMDTEIFHNFPFSSLSIKKGLKLDPKLLSSPAIPAGFALFAELWDGIHGNEEWHEASLGSAVPAFPLGILLILPLISWNALLGRTFKVIPFLRQGIPSSSLLFNREFLVFWEWKAEGGKEIFPTGWIQCRSRGMEGGHWSSQTSGKELGYRGRLFPALRGEIWEFCRDVEKVWIEIPALLKLGASWNPRFLLGKGLKAHPVPWTGNPEHSRPGIHREANLRLWFQQEFQVLKGINAGYSRRSHPRTILSWWKFQQFLWSSSRSLGSVFLLFLFFFFPAFFWELWKAFPGFYPFPLFPVGSVPFDSSSLCFPALIPEMQGMQMILSFRSLGNISRAMDLHWKKKCLEVQDFLKIREKLKEGKYPNFLHFLHPLC